MRGNDNPRISAKLTILFLLITAVISLPSGAPVSASGVSGASMEARTTSGAPARAMGVCPPFQLKDEAGNVIDPTKGLNDKVPYSPKQTCGAKGCHDYAKITEGFHFTQGKGEKLPKEFAAKYNWVTSPGNYGGNWCSPAPLYRQLAQKKNASARTIDMTSFDFVTATCGNCHPGGGPLEFDRDGKRYDQWMGNPASGYTPGGENSLDGDYYKARWSETGVIEADCLMCHMPGYDLKKRNAELAGLNFRWAAIAGAGFGTVSGKVLAGEKPSVAYDKSRFDTDGNVLVHIAPQPRNDACLGCHFKPDWKKRGAGYSTRTDVHMKAGLLCVDCHAAGSRAADPRIRGREIHQFGKGDDPSGWVRNDLDNTVRKCETCHLDGWGNAPKAKHAWLPPLHMQKIACQTCHIPTRLVKSALVQASDVFNPAPRITPPPKRIWTFYDQEMKFWNHYGELDLFTVHDKPTDVSRPTLIRYKGKIYPANRVHSSWVGLEEQGKPGLNQVFMKDFFQMWMQHRSDPKNNYPQLASITDDNKDGIIEVNRPEEIDALLAATRAYLAATGFPMEGKRLVWVSDSRAYYSSTQFRDLSHDEHEATAYASVYKFSHDVAPARAALGAGGCTDCHQSGSPFFHGAALKQPFDSVTGKPVWIPNYQVLGISPFWIALGDFREGLVKPCLYFLAGFLVLLAVVNMLKLIAVRERFLSERMAMIVSLGLVALVVAAVGLSLLTPGLTEYMTISRFALDAKHAWIAVGAFLAAAVICLMSPPSRMPLVGVYTVLRRLCGTLLALTGLSGGFMLLKLPWMESLTRFSYTVFDCGLVLIIFATSALLVLRILTVTTEQKMPLEE